MLKILLWNINGLRSIKKKYVKNNIIFEDYINNFDIVCLNETKINIDTEINMFNEYTYQYFNFSNIKRGYSGVCILSKIKPIRKIKTFTINEGRLIVLEYNKFILVCVYQPNSGAKLKRLNARLEWDSHFIKLITNLQKTKSIIIAGDLNVANENIDIFKPEIHNLSAGFTINERNNFKNLLNEQNLIDIWRYKHKNKIEYTYFNYQINGRKYNNGWRIDYFLLSKNLVKNVKKIKIESDIFGSDHLPIYLKLEFNN